MNTCTKSVRIDSDVDVDCRIKVNSSYAKYDKNSKLARARVSVVLPSFLESPKEEEEEEVYDETTNK